MPDKKKIYIIFIAICVIAAVTEIFFADPHYSNIWNTLPGADLLVGFGGGWLLILLSKKIIAGLFQRREDYYDDGGESDAQ